MCCRTKLILENLNEERLFYLLKRKYKNIIDLNIDDKYTPVDFLIPDKDIYIEVKCRTRHFNSLFLEKDKWEKLIEYKKSWYISSTPEGIWAWNVKKIQPFFIERKMNKTTYFNNRNKVYKKVIELNINDGIELTDLLVKKILRAV